MADFTWTPDYVFEEEIGYDTLVSDFSNGAEQARAKRSNSQRKFKLVFKTRTLSEMQAIRDFFISKKGRAVSFTFTNPNDNATYTVRFFEDAFRPELIHYNIYDFELQLRQVL